MSPLNPIPLLFFASACVLVLLQQSAAQSLPLALSCTSDGDCLKIANHSVCGANQTCICALGFTRDANRTACIQKKCSSASECTAIFPNSTCLNPGTNSSICSCDSSHELDLGTQACAALTDSSSSYSWIISIVVVVFLAILLVATFYVYKRRSRDTKNRQRLLGSNGETGPRENQPADYQSIGHSGGDD